MREFKTLTLKTQKILKSPEGFEVDFKEIPNAIKNRDLVAFANSPSGGTILVGVEEYTNSAGLQRGKIKGCAVDDNAILQIRNKANDCIPPIDLKIYPENISANPILRVEIPYSNKIPHCTKNGEYSIRSERRTRGLFPEELLAIFLSKESELFLGKFRSAIKETEEKIDELRKDVSLTTKDIIDIFNDFHNEVTSNLKDISGVVDDANSHAEDANYNIENVYEIVSNLEKEMDCGVSGMFIENLQRSLDALIFQFKIPDPNLEFKSKEIESLCQIASISKKPVNKSDLKKLIQSRFPFVDEKIIEEKFTKYIK